MRILFVVALLATPVWADAKKAEPKVDPALKGKWEIVSGRFNGNESPSVKGRFLKFTNSELITYYSDEDKDLTVPVKIDASASPKQIDIDRFGDLALGIYTIEKDTLKICYGEPGADRPTKFQSLAGERVFLLVLKRKE